MAARNVVLQPWPATAPGPGGTVGAVASAALTGSGFALRLQLGEALRRCCQVKANGHPIIVEPTNLGRKLTPLGEGSGAVEFEVFAAVEMTFQVEVIAD